MKIHKDAVYTLEAARKGARAAVVPYRVANLSERQSFDILLYPQRRVYFLARVKEMGFVNRKWSLHVPALIRFAKVWQVLN
jgi:hypothetical protein